MLDDKTKQKIKTNIFVKDVQHGEQINRVFAVFQASTSTSSLQNHVPRDTQKTTSKTDLNLETIFISSEKESDNNEISPLPSVDTKITADEEELFDTAAARTRYSTFKHDRDYDSACRTSVYVDGRKVSEDEDKMRQFLARARGKSEVVTTGNVKHYYKNWRLSLHHEDPRLLNLDELFKNYHVENVENDIYQTAAKVNLEDVDKCFDEDNKTANGYSSKTASLGEESEKDQNASHDKDDAKTNECLAGLTSLLEEQQREEEATKTSENEDEGSTGSYFDVKGEMLSFFNKLETNASFVHSTTSQQDSKSSTSDEQVHDGDYNLVKEIEAVLQDLKLHSSPSTNGEDSDTGSYFDMSKEIKNIINNVDKYSIHSGRSGEDNASRKSTPANMSSDSGSFFHVKGELESRLQNLALQVDSSGCDEENQSGKDELAERSYFNMQDEIELRLAVIRHGNVVSCEDFFISEANEMK